MVNLASGVSIFMKAELNLTNSWSSDYSYLDIDSAVHNNELDQILDHLDFIQI